MSNFKKGDKIVCIDDSNQYGGYEDVEKGEVYTILEFRALFCGYAVKLVELGHQEADEYWGFKAERFRKVIYSLSTEASRSLVKTLVVEKIGTKKDKYLEEERELILDENF